MTNSYEVVPQQVTVEEAQRRFQQGEFLRRNHHLISPWMYSPMEYNVRNNALLRMYCDLAIRP